MAHHSVAVILLLTAASAHSLKTCPGFPGYCSESFPGQSCNVVCAFGRINVPLCQEDGTWTDIPRCIEHEPGVDNQVPGVCPGIPGYCAQGFLHGRCKFDCVTGPDIDSLCSSDGTWVPYPVCDGDLRETRDGCDGCPGPLGSNRNRTAETLLSGRGQTDSRNLSNRIPKVGSLDEGRKTIPTFAGNTQFGSIDPESKALQQQPSFKQQRPEQPTFQPQRQQQAFPQPQQQGLPQQQQQAFPQQQQEFPQQSQQAFPQQQQQTFPRQQQQLPQQQQFPQQQQQQFPQQQQQGFQQGLNTFQPNSPANQPLSLFDQIKSKINQGNRQQPAAPQPQQLPQPQQQLPQPQQQLLQPQQQLPQQLPSTPGQQTFGPFESVSLNNALQGAERPRVVASPRSRLLDRPASQNNDDFFGVFPSVNLQQG